MQQGCDICGRSDAHLKAKVAGMDAVVCDRCANLGVVTGEIEEPKKPSEAKRIEQKKAEIVQRVTEVVEDIGAKVHKKREELGLTQEDLAKRISEHESMVKRIEHGLAQSSRKHPHTQGQEWRKHRQADNGAHVHQGPPSVLQGAHQQAGRERSHDLSRDEQPRGLQAEAECARCIEDVERIADGGKAGE